MHKIKESSNRNRFSMADHKFFKLMLREGWGMGTSGNRNLFLGVF